MVRDMSTHSACEAFVERSPAGMVTCKMCRSLCMVPAFQVSSDVLAQVRGSDTKETVPVLVAAVRRLEGLDQVRWLLCSSCCSLCLGVVCGPCSVLNSNQTLQIAAVPPFDDRIVDKWFPRDLPDANSSAVRTHSEPIYVDEELNTWRGSDPVVD